MARYEPAFDPLAASRAALTDPESEPLPVQYRRHQHAAHYQGMPGQGHDLEEWDVTGYLPRNRSFEPIAPASVPSDAEYHSGYLDKDGRQHWLFVRVAPLTGTCKHCEVRS